MLLIILGSLITLFTAIVSLMEKWKKKDEPDYRKKNNSTTKLFIFTVAGIILALVAGVNAIKQKKKSDKAAKERQVKIDSLTNAILNLTIASSEYETGKGSFCYFDLGMKGPIENSYRFVLHSSGKNPMDNVTARIADVYDLVNNPMGTNLDIGKIYPKDDIIVPFASYYKPVKPDSIWLNIFFQTAGREIVETLKEVRLNGKWISSIIVSEEGKILFKKIDKEFIEVLNKK